MKGGKESDSFDGAISRTGNQTGRMGSGEVMGGGRGHDEQNKANPYGPNPMQGPKTYGGRPSSSEEKY